MSKFSFKRPRIISKKFPRVDSTIDDVTKSLNDLVFLYSEQVDKSLHRKRIMMAISSMVLLLVLGSFISPYGKAESSVFYPETCLGGWINPEYAQGEEQTTSNGDEAQFTKTNSAVLPKNTNAEMYCGNFKGKFDASTKPVKIIVSLALTKGGDLSAEDMMEYNIHATSSISTEGTSTDFQIDVPLLATTTLEIASSSDKATTTEATTTGPEVVNPSTTPQNAATSTVLNGIIESFKDTIDTIFSSDNNNSGNTDTVVVPPPAESQEAPQTPPENSPEAPLETSPQSLLPLFKNILGSLFLERVFAEEAVTPGETVLQGEAPTLEEPIENKPQKEEVVSLEVATTSSGAPDSSSQQIILPSEERLQAGENTASSSENGEAFATTSTSTLPYATSTEVITSTTSSTEVTDDNQFQNNFLEVLYTFDGVTWIPLGELNEISMKYRTFEIPVTASTSWSDLGHLQIKIVSKRHSTAETPTVYLDGIKVEVLYDSTMEHQHPDFARDTILKDEIVDGVRFVTLINSDNSLKEIWYMYLDEAQGAVEDIATTTEATSTVATSTIATSTTITNIEATGTQAYIDVASSTGTSTEKVGGMASTTASSTEKVAIIDLLKNKWRKYEGADLDLSSAVLVKFVKEKDLREEKKKQDELPDFTVDVIKKMKGTFLDSVVVQIERITETDVSNELWVYDAQEDKKEKIGEASSTTIAPDSPLGLKDGYLFWESSDKQILYAYNLETKTTLSQPLPSFDSSNGERAEIHFEDIKWKVIVSNEGFSFFSPETGEVFSDDNSKTVEVLRQRMGLDSVLDKDELSNLNLPVTATDTQQH